MRQPFLRLLAGLASTCLLSFAATLPASSALSGLNSGDTYHFVFVTNATTAASNTTLAFYNNFVQTAANAAGIGNTIGLTWTAMVSVGGSPLRGVDNAPVSATSRVYLLNGTMVANGGTNPFYTEAVDHLAPINYTETEATLTSGLVWTGGNANGTESGSGLVGGSNPIAGDLNGLLACRCTGGWARNGNAGPNSNQFRLYAISAPLTVAANTAVPEPSTLGLSALALGALIAIRRRS